MRRRLSTTALVAALFSILLGGCQSPPESQDAPPAPTQEQGQTPEDDRMGEEEEKINNDNDLDEEGPADGSACPPPRESDAMCAQVITWARGPQGQCCQYPTPCTTPEGWETFSSEAECAAAVE